MGVITVSDVDYGRIYGPFPALGNIPQSHFIGCLTADERHETGHVKINLNDGSLGNSWLPYIQPARYVDEQNMEAYLKNGHIFYRTLRIIRAEEELLVWYSKDFTEILGIPFKTSVHNQDGCSSLICEFCGEEFCYIFPLMAHIKFRCNKTHIDQGITNNECNKKTSTGQNMAVRNNGTINLPVKRRIEIDENHTTSQKVLVATIKENNNDGNSNNISSGTITKLNDIGSAFRKVGKAITRDNDNSRNDIVHVSKEPIYINESTMRLYHDTSDIARHAYNNGIASSLSRSISMLMNSWVSPLSSATHRTYVNPRLSLSSVSNSDYVGWMNTFSHETLTNIPNANVYSKQMLMEQVRKSQLPCTTTSNPMVVKILQTTTPTMLQTPTQAVNLAQNWCAKCNAIFRMTSDLVYHMRSHHKREFDPIKRKGEHMLHCHACNETFKERHHLMRHMVSHTQ